MPTVPLRKGSTTIRGVNRKKTSAIAMLKVVLVRSVKTSERVRPTAVLLSSCTATRSWSTEPGKRLARQYSVGSRELGAADRRAYSGAGGLSRQDEQMLMEITWRADGCTAHLFSLACRRKRRVSTHGPPAACWSLEGSAEETGRGTADCGSSRCALPAALLTHV